MNFGSPSSLPQATTEPVSQCMLRVSNPVLSGQKGDRTVAAIARNTQLSMFEELDELPSANREQQIETWFLLPTCHR